MIAITKFKMTSFFADFFTKFLAFIPAIVCWLTRNTVKILVNSKRYIMLAITERKSHTGFFTHHCTIRIFGIIIIWILRIGIRIGIWIFLGFIGFETVKGLWDFED